MGRCRKTTEGKRHLFSFLEHRVEAISMQTKIWGDRFVFPCLRAIILLSFAGPRVCCSVKDHESA